jgi:hypothetical protein
MSTRIEHLERRVELLDTELNAVRLELRALKHPAPAPTPPPAPLCSLPGVGPVKEQRDPRTPPAPAQVMAWVGGSALLVALILFLALAVSRGWIGEEARTAMAALASLLLTAGGARAYERRGRTEAAVAATAAGVAGGFATLAVATEVYALVPAALGLPLGLAWGATAAALALRWRSRTIAVLGIAGGLLSPVLAGADVESAQTIALLAIGYAGAAVVATRLGWGWLGLLAFTLVTPQWGWHVGATETLPFVIVFGAIGAFAATACRSGVLLTANAAVVAAAGYGVLWEPQPTIDGKLWLAGLAAAHAAGGLVMLRRARPFAIAALGIGVTLGDLAFADLASGVVLPLVWAASVVLLAWLAREHPFAAIGVVAHVGLAVAHLLAYEAPLADLPGNGGAAAVVTAAAIAVACLVSGRLLPRPLGGNLDVVGLLAVAYATTLALEGAPLVAALAAEAAVLGAVGRREPAAIAFWLYAVAGAVVVAPPAALDAGLIDPGAAVLALLAIAAAAPAVSRSEEGRAAGALALLYLASILAVTYIDGQPGQLTLSALWGTVGLAALLSGIVRDHAHLRTIGLSLLAVTTAKVFVVDLASLDSLTRVGSFVAIGSLLLAGAFAWQRARPS